ncbi:MAG: response regulator [Chitinivibrionales bacterium]|nr:response regulator [Chitinivibrionales bacterium]
MEANGPIVYVDDDEDCCQVVKLGLQKSGIKSIIVFQNPFKALQAITAGLFPSLVISDYTMPGMNGIELLNRISQSLPQVKRFFIVTGTAYLLENITHPYVVVEKGGDFLQAIRLEIKHQLQTH